MMAQGNTVSVLLIDGENVPAKFADKLAELVSEAGREIVAGVYGDFSSGALNEWRDRAAKFGFRLHQTSGKPGGRNSADMLLAVDALEFMFTSDHKHFCIASGDGDFTALAIRLRHAGLTVTGGGMGSASSAFRLACDHYRVLAETPAAKSAPKPAAVKSEAKSKDIATHFDAVCATLPVDEKGWMQGARIATAILAAFPGTKWTSYGHTSFKKVLQAHSGFEVAKNQKELLVRRVGKAKNPVPVSPAVLKVVSG